MVGELDVFRTEGSTRFVVELLVAVAVLLAVDYLVVVPALKTASPAAFAGSVDYGKYSSFPDTPLDFAHLGFMLVTFGSFYYWRLYHTAFGRRFAEAYRETRK